MPVSQPSRRVAPRAPAPGLSLTYAPRLTLVAVLLFAFALRVYRLGAKSLWLDEGLSVSFAARELPRMLSTLVAEDIHPPLYYLFLNGALASFGFTEFAVRYTAAISGVLLVAATYALGSSLARGHGGGRSVRSAGVGLVSATLVAISPFLVAYSQEARMYADLALWTTLSSLAFWRVLRGQRTGASTAVEGEPPNQGRRLWRAAYVLATVAALYTHYFAALVLAGHALFAAGLSVRKRAIQWWWVALAALSAAAVAPWVVGLTAQMRRLLDSPDFWKGELSLTFVVEKIFTAFALGKSGIPVQSLPLVALFAVAFGVGVVLLLRSGIAGGRGDAFTLTCLVVPLVLLYAISARNPKFTERYLIMIAPYFYVVLARLIVDGSMVVARLARRRAALVGPALATAATIALVVVSAGELRRVYFGPGYEKDDNRAAIAYILAHEQPGDGIVLMMNSDHVFKYYYRGTSPWRGLHPGDDAAYAASELNAFTTGKKRLWLLLWQEYWADPTGFTRDSLDSAYSKLDSIDSFQGLKIRLYAIDPAVKISTVLEPSVARPVNFGDAVRLAGLDPPKAAVRSGSNMSVTLYWQAARQLDEDYIVSLRLLVDGQRWARGDQRPTAFTFPTMMWRPGVTVRGRIEIGVPAGTPPGSYDLELVVYSYDTRRDLTVIGADGRPTEPRAVIGTVVVVPANVDGDPASLNLARRVDAELGPLLLTGVTLGAEKARPGSRVDVSIGWQAVGAVRTDARATVSLVGVDGGAVDVSSRRPGGEAYPSDRWAEGEVILDRRTIVVPPDMPAGPVAIRVRVEPAAGSPGIALTAEVGSIEIASRLAVMTPPPRVDQPTNVTFGRFARLIGYSLGPTQVRAGDQARLTLHWRADGAADREYVVFTHLLDGQSRVVAQRDKPPLDGANPTTGWLAGEFVSDEYLLRIPANAEPGEYDLEVGMYDPDTGARAQATDGSGAPAGDRIVLGRVNVVR